MVFDVAQWKIEPKRISLSKAEKIAVKHIINRTGKRQEQVSSNMDGDLKREISVDAARSLFYSILVRVEPYDAYHVKVHAIDGGILGSLKVGADVFDVADVPDVILPVPSKGVKETELEETEDEET
jgi:hypothetical protein